MMACGLMMLVITFITHARITIEGEVFRITGFQLFTGSFSVKGNDITGTDLGFVRSIPFLIGIVGLFVTLLSFWSLFTKKPEKLMMLAILASGIIALTMELVFLFCIGIDLFEGVQREIMRIWGADVRAGIGSYVYVAISLFISIIAFRRYRALS